jgi:hypothetical protein
MMARAVRLDRIARRLALAVLLQLFACASPPLEERPWLEVQSAGFTIYTDLDRERAIASARRSLLWSSERENDEAQTLLESLLADAPTATSN